MLIKACHVRRDPFLTLVDREEKGRLFVEYASGLEASHESDQASRKSIRNQQWPKHLCCQHTSLYCRLCVPRFSPRRDGNRLETGKAARRRASFIQLRACCDSLRDDTLVQDSVTIHNFNPFRLVCGAAMVQHTYNSSHARIPNKVSNIDWNIDSSQHRVGKIQVTENYARFVRLWSRAIVRQSRRRDVACLAHALITSRI